MKVKFKGLKQKKKGCVPCGMARGTLGFERLWDATLPSGAKYRFRVNQTYEVSQEDGEWLAQYTYTDRFGTHNAFEVVDG